MKKITLALLLLLLPVQSWAFTVYFKDGSTLNKSYSIYRYTPEIYGYDGDKILAKDGHEILGDEVKVIDYNGKEYVFYWDTIDVKQTVDSIREEWQSVNIIRLQLVQEDHERRIRKLEDGQKEAEARIAQAESRMSELSAQINSLQNDMHDMNRDMVNIKNLLN